MRAQIGYPDSSPPGVSSLLYSIFCWMNRHPGVWRAIGAAWRTWPFLFRLMPLAARRGAVKEALTRPESFSNASHEPNLFAGEYLIGMEPGTRYDADRVLFESILNLLSVEVDADREAKARLARLTAPGAPNVFDLIEDYLQWVVFNAIKPSFGAAIDGVVSGRRDQVPDEATERRYLCEVRNVAAQLFAGHMAPLWVKRRAELSALSLRQRIDKMTPELKSAWPAAQSMDALAIQRNAIGLAWVSHPVTVQSGALAVQELLGRSFVYEELRCRAHALKDAVWTDQAFRQSVRDHVLELMRFRPIFPLLAREVPRDTELGVGSSRNPVCPAGSSLTVLSISALFDSRDMKDMDRFCPHRHWGSDDGLRYLMFGYGGRQCPAKNHAVMILTSALIGLLTLPRLRWADRRGSRIGYDGPMITRIRLRHDGR